MWDAEEIVGIWRGGSKGGDALVVGAARAACSRQCTYRMPRTARRCARLQRRLSGEKQEQVKREMGEGELWKGTKPEGGQRRWCR